MNYSTRPIPKSHVSVKSLVMFLAASAMAVNVATVWAFQLRAGPMVGGGGMRSVWIWLQGDSAGQVQLEYWNPSRSDMKKKSLLMSISEATDYTANIDIDELEPGQTYNYRVLLTATGSDRPTLAIPHTASVAMANRPA
jgi:phosphodiesterase/alkaline phosphatase D-like protein